MAKLLSSARLAASLSLIVASVFPIVNANPVITRSFIARGSNDSLIDGGNSTGGSVADEVHLDGVNVPGHGFIPFELPRKDTTMVPMEPPNGVLASMNISVPLMEATNFTIPAIGTNNGTTSTLDARQSGLRVMIVGDSITQGTIGDYTWRYRMWQWFQQESVAVTFVGPYQGTHNPVTVDKPQPPRLEGEAEPPQVPRTDGAYAGDVSGAFPKAHFAVWGRQLMQAKRQIREQVAAHQPDILLVALGFNDVGWFVSDDDGTLNSMGEFISEARAAKSNIKFALANIPHRTFIGGREDLVVNTAYYNAKLRQTIPALSFGESQVALVELQQNYNCKPDGCPSAYDGLHPNARGEFEIAQAFSRTLIKAFRIGSKELAIANVPSRSPATPGGVRAYGSPQGVTVEWNAAAGASSYEYQSRIQGVSDFGIPMPTAGLKGFTTWTVGGITWEYRVRSSYGDSKSAWSNIVSAVSAPQTPDPPSPIYSVVENDYFFMLWNSVPGATLYEAIWYDQDTPGAFLSSVGTRANSITIRNVKPGHRYVVAVTAWNEHGGGLPGGGKPVRIGPYVPGAPSGLRVTATDPTTVDIEFCGVEEAAAYRIYTRNINEAGSQLQPDLLTTMEARHGVAFLFPGTWNYEFCAQAFNGEANSTMSKCVTAPRPGEGTAGGQVIGNCYKPPCAGQACPPAAPGPIPQIPNVDIPGDDDDDGPIPATKPWFDVSCSTGPLVSDIMYTGPERWSAAKADEAWEDALLRFQDFRRVNPGVYGGGAEFSQIIADHVHATSARQCINIPNTPCDQRVQCDDQFGGGATGVSSPAGYMIINSMANIHNVMADLDQSLSKADAQFQSQSSTIVTAFAQFGNTQDMQIALDVVSLTIGMVSAPLWNSWIRKLGSFKNYQNTFDTVKDSLATIVAFSTSLAKDLLPSNSDLNTANNFRVLAGGMVLMMRNVNANLARKFFSGEDLKTITGLLKGGASAGVYIGATPIDMENHFYQILVATFIPTAWKANDAGTPFITPAGNCDWNRDHTEGIWFTPDEGRTSYGCVNGQGYYLKMFYPQSCSARVCTPADGMGPVRGWDRLKGNNFGGLKMENLITSSVRSWELNGKKNGWGPLEMGNADVVGTMAEDGVNHPGVFSVPICSESEALENLRFTGGKVAWTHWPCNKV